MAETLKIEIEMEGGYGENASSEAAGIKSSTAKDNATAFFTFDRAKSIATQFSTTIVNRHVASIGSRTGNYVLQERVQKGLSIVAKAASVGMSFAINPYLGAIHLVTEVVIAGVNMAFDVAEKNREIMWQNRAANELARRAGYLANQNR